MRSFLFRALWLSSVVSAQQVITITEWRKCSTSAVFSLPTSTSPQTTISTQTIIGISAQAGSSTQTGSSSTATPRATKKPNPFAVVGPSFGVGALSPTAQNNVDNLFWLNYGRMIMQLAEIHPSDNNAFFLGSSTQRGPLAGDGIPEEYTNQGLHDLGNNLLNDSSIFYSPSTNHGYIEALRNVLNFVDPEAEPTPDQEVELLKLLKAQDAAQIKTDTELEKAQNRFGLEGTAGLTNGKTFLQWYESGKAPAYRSALQYEQEISAQIDSLQSDMLGLQATQVQTDRTSLGKAFSDADNPGYNMNVAAGQLSSPAELLDCYNRGVECPKPPPSKRPQYSAEGYKAFIQAAQHAGVKALPQQHREFKIDTSEDTSNFNFGQTSSGGGAHSNGWFSFYSAAGQETTTKNLQTGSAASSVNIKIFYDDIKAVTIAPGDWNFDVSAYKLKSTAPGNLKQLYKTTQIVVASRLGYNITVSDGLASTLDAQFKQTTAAGGGFSIFGIRIGAKTSKTDIKETHNASFDRASNTVTIMPRSDTGTATLVGVVGEKVTIRVAG